mmetsp:Transcript_4921/g.11035  ORF Transcript_4921/g.11035 Transcript_4921/m.11035 type:complete len:715 (+) Transcript_4921:172-2316(+)
MITNKRKRCRAVPTALDDFVNIPKLMNGMLKQKRTSEMCSRRWGAILSISERRGGMENFSSYSGGDSIEPSRNSSGNSSNHSDDPFDCTDLQVPTNAAILEKEASKAIQKWRDLDSRLVEDEDDVGDADGHLDENLSFDGNFVGSWFRSRILPPDFDYRCRRGAGTHPENEFGAKKARKMNADSKDALQNQQQEEQPRKYKPRVISLSDPTKTEDYEEELWKIFHSMPTVATVEESHGIDGSSVRGNDSDGKTEDRRTRKYKNRKNRHAVPLVHGCQYTLRVKKDLQELLPKYTRMDAHSLGRLRVRDRHSLPLKAIMNSSAISKEGLMKGEIPSNGTNAGGEARNKTLSTRNNTTATTTTIRFEILRYCSNLKRGSSPDNNRLEVELSGSLTLLDLHRVLVECKSQSYGGGNIENSNNSNVSGGVFFIENKFYTHGNSGKAVADAINEWLVEIPMSSNETTSEEDGVEASGAKAGHGNSGTAGAPFRKRYLGLQIDAAFKEYTRMSEALLEETPLRLGVRYFHLSFPPTTSGPSEKQERNIWSLNDESAVFVTGIQTHIIPDVGDTDTKTRDGTTVQQKSDNRIQHGKTKLNITTSCPPIMLHDVWSTAKNLPTCHACNTVCASVVTMNDTMADSSNCIDIGSNWVDSDGSRSFQGTALCSGCYRELHYRRVSPSMLELRRENSKEFRVLPVEDFFRRAIEETLKELPRNAGF